MIHRLFAAAAFVVPLTVTATQASAQADPQPPGVPANYDGRVIDLSEGWGSALACASDGVTAECFDSEAELDSYLSGVTGEQAPSSQDATLATCGTSTRLYAGTSFGTPVLAITQRLSWINLGPLGFDNITRSYKGSDEDRCRILNLAVVQVSVLSGRSAPSGAGPVVS